MWPLLTSPLNAYEDTEKNIKIARLKTKPYRKSIDKLWEQSQDTIRLRVLGQNNPVLPLIVGIVLPCETETMTQRTRAYSSQKLWSRIFTA